MHSIKSQVIESVHLSVSTSGSKEEQSLVTMYELLSGAEEKVCLEKSLVKE